MATGRSLRPPRAPTSQKTPAIPPTARKVQSIAPPAVSKITISVHDIYLAMLVQEVVNRLLKYEEEVIDIGFDDRAYAGDLLRALQTYPKPAKTYLVKANLGTGIKGFEVEPLPNDVFRVTLKKT